MNTIQIAARFENKPSDKDIENIEKEIVEFLNSITELENVNIRTMDGSWWIVISGVTKAVGNWVAIEASSWGLQKILDKMKESLGRRFSKPTQTSTSLTPISHTNANFDSFERLSKTAYNLDKLATKIGVTQISLGDWSDEMGTGRIIKLRKGSKELSLELIQTDNQDDFDSRIAK